MINFNCSECGVKIAIKDEFAGKKGRCPKCKAVLTIPAAAAPPDPGEYDLALEDGSEAEARGIATDAESRRKCPGCGVPMAEVLVVCPRCGMNRETGMQVGEYLFGDDKSAPEKTGGKLPLILAVAGGAAALIVVIIIAVVMIFGEKEPSVQPPREGSKPPEGTRPGEEKVATPGAPEEGKKQPEPPKEEKPERRFPTDPIVKDYIGTSVHQITRQRDRVALLSIEQSIKTFQAIEGRLPKSLDEIKDLRRPPEGLRYVYDPETGKVVYGEEEPPGTIGSGIGAD